MTDSKDISFEKALSELENIVKSLESGSLSLEDALNTFERGVHLTKHCQQALSSAEQKISQLTANDAIEPLQNPAEDLPS